MNVDLTPHGVYIIFTMLILRRELAFLRYQAYFSRSQGICAQVLTLSHNVGVYLNINMCDKTYILTLSS